MSAARFPFGQAASQIALDTAGGLVTILGRLGEQLHDDRRDGALGRSLTARLGGTGFLAIWQCTHSMGSAAVKGRDAREHLVKRDAEGVEIAAGVDRAVHPPGLFGCHVGKRTGDGLGRLGRLPLAGQARCDAKSGELARVQSSQSTTILAGLMSLWMRPR